MARYGPAQLPRAISCERSEPTSGVPARRTEQRARTTAPAETGAQRTASRCRYSYRFAHIDGRIPANPAQYVRRPRVQPVEQHGMDRSELGRFLFTAEHHDPAHAALAVLLGLNGFSEACATNIEDLSFERGHRTLRILGKGNRPAVIPLVPRTARTIDLAIGERHQVQSCNVATGTASTDVPHTVGCARSASEPASATSTPTCCAPRSSWPPSTLASRCATSNSQLVTQTRAPPRSTTAAARTSTATPPTLSSPSSPAADRRRRNLTALSRCCRKPRLSGESARAIRSGVEVAVRAPRALATSCREIVNGLSSLVPLGDRK